MIFESCGSKFELLKNEKDAFSLPMFEKRYISECFDKYVYLVGDVSDDILRIKGFCLDPKSKNHFRFIPDYLTEAGNLSGEYYILRRLKENVEQK